MKKIVLLFCITLSILQIKAYNDKPLKNDCDVCSTSSNSTSINFNSNSKTYFGLNFIYQKYKTYNGIFKNSKQFNEQYRTIQLSGNLKLSQKWNTAINIPIHTHYRELEDHSISQNENGFGDITLQSSYLVLNSDSSSTRQWKWFIGSGVKIPTAKYESRDGQGTNPNFNLGSGAWDILLSTQFNIKLKNSGINTQINYAFKTENDDDFQFGNQTDISILYIKQTNWLTSINTSLLSGIKSEFYQNNSQNGYRITNSKGQLHQIQLGTDLGLNKINFGFMAFIPISQNLMDKRIKSQFRGLIYARYSI